MAPAAPATVTALKAPLRGVAPTPEWPTRQSAHTRLTLAGDDALDLTPHGEPERHLALLDGVPIGRIVSYSQLDLFMAMGRLWRFLRVDGRTRD